MDVRVNVQFGFLEIDGLSRNGTKLLKNFQNGSAVATSGLSKEDQVISKEKMSERGGISGHHNALPLAIVDFLRNHIREPFDTEHK